MTVSIGAPADLMRTADTSRFEEIKSIGKTWGLTTLLSAIQLLDETIVKMKHSVQSRILLEVALVQICTLADLQAIADVVQGISQNLNPAVVPNRAEISTPNKTPNDDLTKPEDLKKKVPLTPNPLNEISSNPTDPSKIKQPDLEIVGENTPNSTLADKTDPRSLLATVALGLEGLSRQLASLALEVIEHPENHWEIRLAKEAQMTLSKFSSPENIRRLTDGLKRLTGHDLTLSFVVTDKPMPNVPGAAANLDQNSIPKASQPQRIREVMADPLIKQFIELLGGEVIKVDDP
jgi:DNA polymerase-3 subunit gamma/tau